ncbi:hypothetical protein [Pseudosulfitobacter koreensis]|uniref:ABC transmembrane type-1 domain-containing protein n=1 Tax=Pseudosulfitobacter koreensis TaxID=2968472 RepID=A0ABT1Z1G2_9RHOB|nr:hypothetical protein [Pseudosulfitobacter koreense]MCR8826966.1 hypothetical protein [Pseudosulfitobacter koreense]
MIDDNGPLHNNRDFFALKHAIVMEEWKVANTNIGRLDSVVFTIRGWAITTTTAAVAYAYTKPDPRVCMLILIPLLFLWLIDALFKTFQRVFIDRSKEIEVYLASDSFEQDFQDERMSRFVSPELSIRFGQNSSGERLRKVIEQAFLRNVVFTYVPLIIFAMIAYGAVKISQPLRGSGL